MVGAVIETGAVRRRARPCDPGQFLLAEAVKRLPAATVYAMFVGIGTAGTAIVGLAFFRESTNLGRVCSLILIVIGIIGLRLFSGAAE